MSSQQPPAYADRSYRSSAALAGGVLLLAVALWIGGDAVLRGEGRTPLTAGAFLLAAVPLIVAFTLRPAVFAGAERLRVRNPFRTVAVPWGAVGSIRSGYSNELVTEDGRKVQLWAIPVSLRGRRSAQRRNARLSAGGQGRGGFSGVFGMGGVSGADEGPRQAEGDEAVATLRDLAERQSRHTGEVTVRWAYEILVPAVLGGLTLLAVLVTG
ncbi:PH domain-containing protein [Streptomyces sp. TRM 70351]|uniref:PH domain-containing protein n=1 Tax=Streptomyces sp. TRM 70351 TaxID=3116552 RepID=UPI002E7B8BC9|nr:PH domain-containing protein [Streptomyces sp. TRM 70351]MEE1927891.1 PH domain-containing protein [Streptomyces sp. TRM 70351]